MTTIGVTMVGDEADIIETTLRHMASQVDHLIVADNLSTDGTRGILDDLAMELPLSVVDDPEPGYYQSRKMTELAHVAGKMGADWVVPFDADELWTVRGSTVAEALEQVEPQVAVVTAEIVDHMATGEDPDDPNPVRRMGWRRPDPLPLHKVAVRYRHDLTIHQGNHGADYGFAPVAVGPWITIHHYPYRSAEQLVRKVRRGAAAYAAAEEMPENVGAHWRQWGRILDERGEAAIHELFRVWYWRREARTPVRIQGERQPGLVWDPIAVP